ncbi:hypothetical protein DFQ27_006425 [Actinomortierella ambigua]|uniref:Uncharacterized protein n=1 Tax=Actinomortierella ambigua TaxID=1343610 RepID=A0A9P6PZ36_9FUNG|nr:hypothetical protein DFQ27_006425 [Actinomortierella ambigua]
MPNPSSTLLVYWLFTALISIFPTRSTIEEFGIDNSVALLKLLFTLVSFVVFGLENIPKIGYKSLKRATHVTMAADTKLEQPNPSPEPYANFFVRITFLWLVPLLNKGKKQPLRMDDLWSLHPKMLSYPLFLTSQAKMDADEAIALQRAEAKKKEEKGTEEAEVAEQQQQLRKVNLLGVVMHTVGWSFLSAIVPRLLYIPTLYVRPVLFSALITFMDTYSEKSRATGREPDPAWKGYGLAIAVLATSVLSGLFDAQFTNICFQGAIRARGAFVSLIYRKALRLSSTTKQEGIGAIVNHMSSDVDRILQLFTVVHYLWSGIVEVIVVAVLLYNEIQYAMFASMGVALVMVCLATVSASQIGVAQKKMMGESDKRMKLISELVNYIKSVKLYAWERYFVRNISASRTRQLKHLKHFFLWVTFVSSIFNSVVAFAIFAALTTYSAIAPADSPLDIRRIFVTITLVNMLDGPLGQISSSFSNLISGKVAYTRVKNFIESEEIRPDNLERHPDARASEIAYEIRDGTFGWYTPEAIKSMTEKREKEAKEKAEKEAKDKKKQSKNKSKDKEEDEKDNDKDQYSTLSSSSDGGSHSTTNEKTDEASRDTHGPVLHNISLTIKRGSLTAVVGRVGEGKSSLVGALLGEMYKYNGTVRSYGSLAYVAQMAWIINDTVRNNILFGLKYDKERYFNVIKACALTPDFKMLIDGDKTLIGEKGINLSGGQKQRISIARAVYANADVYIFDDPLSAVDAHVDHHIFEEAINKLLADKTRILVTNGVHHLKDVDQVVVIKQGEIAQDGRYEELIQDTNGDLCRLVEESKKTLEAVQETYNESSSEDSSSETEGDSFSVEDEDDKEKDAKSIERPAGPTKRPTYHRHKSSKRAEEEPDMEDHKEVDEEVTREGRVGRDVYKYYINAVGTASCITFFFVAIGLIAIEYITQLWLKNWGNDNQKAVPSHSNTYWQLTYLGWLLSTVFMLSFSIGVTIVVMGRRASKNLHASMLTPLVRSPMSFFDVTSSGKIINRFSHDISSVDIELPISCLNVLFILMAVILQFAFAITATPYFLILLVPLLAAYYYLAGYFLVSSRELKRLDSAARSPMYGHFGETLSGLVTIRSFGHGERFAMQATKMLDQSQQVYYLTNSTQRWLQMMLEFLSDIILGFIAVMAVLQRGNGGSAGVFGIVLSQIGNLTFFVRRLMMDYCLLETNIVAVERIREYSQLTPEARDVIPDSNLDDQWPQQGKIEFDNYSTRYRDGLDLVLKDIQLSIQPGERVGIVGRTGAGKSSVTLALFRIIEAAAGSIKIDGVDISTLGLAELRSRLTIIPQEPFLFGGTIRLNLDPLDAWQDADLWAALESASLKSYVSSLPEGLNTVIDNGGENMSLGQRQLMSLARAMLNKHTKVLCLDEATAAIDIETDNAIQEALRRSFNGCTVLTIAHRINTIMDSDRILVLDHGRVAEFDQPKTLLENPNSIFYSLAKTSEAARTM